MIRDYAEKEYLEDNRIFADLLNGFIYQGRSVIKADQLRSIDPVRHIRFIDKQGEETIRERLSDLSKSLSIKTDGRKIYTVINEQNQTKTDYGMPLRNLFIELAEYMKQAEIMTAENNQNREKKISFISDLQPSDRFMGVISITVLFSSEDWDGPESFEEMIDSDDDLKRLMLKSPLNLVVPARMSADQIMTQYPNDLGLVFLYLKSCRTKKDLKNLLDNYGPAYYSMDLKAAELINFITGDDFLYNVIIKANENRLEGSDMSEGMRQLLEEARETGFASGKEVGFASGKEAGFESGKESGQRELLLKLILKRSEKGNTPEEIAEYLDIRIDEVLGYLKNRSS